MKILATESATFRKEDILVCPSCGHEAPMDSLTAKQWKEDMARYCDCGYVYVIRAGVVMISEKVDKLPFSMYDGPVE